jgi:hypothetical protein
MKLAITPRGLAAAVISGALAVSLAGAPAQAAVNDKFSTTYEMDAFAGIDFQLTNRVLFDARGVKCALTAEQLGGPTTLDLSNVSETAITVNTATLGDYTINIYCAQYGKIDDGFTMLDLRDPHGGNILTTTYTVHVVTSGGVILNPQTYRVTQSGTDATLPSPIVGANSSTSAPVYSVAAPETGVDAQCSVDAATGRLTFLQVGTCILTVTIPTDGTYPEISDSAVITIIADPYIYTVTVYGWVQKSGSSKNDKSLSAARARAVRTYLRAQGLEAVQFTALGKGIKGRTAKARSAYVVISWTGPTTGRVATTIYFSSSSSKISTKYKRALRVLWGRVPRN